jgi:hypothetical protein
VILPPSNLKTESSPAKDCEHDPHSLIALSGTAKKPPDRASDEENDVLS